MRTTRVKLHLLALLVPLFAGCSSQDFVRPMGGLSDVADSGRAYVERDEGEDAIARAERLAQVLGAWREQRDVPIGDYTVAADDILDVGVVSLEQPGEIATRRVSVTRQGSVPLPFVGDVQVAGNTASEAADIIAAAYEGKYLKNPQITVAVSEYRSRPVVLTGAVAKPGVYYLEQNQSSVLEVLSKADGPSDDAGAVLLIIRAPGGRKSGEERELSGGEPEPDASPAHTPAVSPVDAVSESVPENAAGELSEEKSGSAAEVAGVAEEPGKGEPPRRRSLWAVLRGKPKPRAEDEDEQETATTSGEDGAPDGAAGKGGVAAEGADPAPDAEEPGDARPLPDAAPAVSTPQAETVATESNPANEPEVITVDLKRLLDEGDVRFNVTVKGGDIVSIPPAKKKYIYVLGYVNAPGAFELQDRDDLRALQAVARAGGLGSAARAQNSALITQEDGVRKVIQVDLAKIAHGVRPPVYMKPGDTLIVGSSVLARLAEFVKPTASVGASASMSPVP